MPRSELQAIQERVILLENALLEAKHWMLEISAQLDLPTVGKCKWQLMRCADTITAALRGDDEAPGQAAD